MSLLRRLFGGKAKKTTKKKKDPNKGKVFWKGPENNWVHGKWITPEDAAARRKGYAEFQAEQAKEKEKRAKRLEKAKSLPGVKLPDKPVPWTKEEEATMHRLASFTSVDPDLDGPGDVGKFVTAAISEGKGKPKPTKKEAARLYLKNMVNWEVSGDGGEGDFWWWDYFPPDETGWPDDPMAVMQVLQKIAK